MWALPRSRCCCSPSCRCTPLGLPARCRPSRVAARQKDESAAQMRRVSRVQSSNFSRNANARASLPAVPPNVCPGSPRCLFTVHTWPKCPLNLEPPHGRAGSAFASLGASRHHEFRQNWLKPSARVEISLGCAENKLSALQKGTANLRSTVKLRTWRGTRTAETGKGRPTR